MNKLLVYKNLNTNEIYSTSFLAETDNIKYEIIENPPEIEQKEGFIGYYTFDENNNLIVAYKEKEQTIEEKLEILQTENQALKTENQDLSNYLLELDERLSNLGV